MMNYTLYDYCISVFDEYAIYAHNIFYSETEQEVSIESDDDAEYEVVNIQSTQPTPSDCAYAMLIHSSHYSLQYSKYIAYTMFDFLSSLPLPPLHDID